METKQYKRLLLIVMIIAAFIFAVSLASLYAQRVISCGEAQMCTIPIPLLIPIAASVGLFIGTLVYYLMVGRLKKKDINLGECSAIVGKLFNEKEKVILRIIASRDSVSQAKVTSLAELPRLKVFRIIEKLKEKGLIEKQEEGKRRIIKAKEGIKELIKNIK